MQLKIGRKIYDISANDTFMDNGSCVLLTSQDSGLSSGFGGVYNPVLSKRAIKEIAAFERGQLQHGYGSDIQIFSLNIK